MKWLYSEDGAAMALAFMFFFSALSPTSRVHAQDKRESPADIFKESESVLNEFVKNILTARRNPSEESSGRFRSTAARLNDLVDSMERLLAAQQGPEEARLLRERIADLREFAKFAKPDSRDVFLRSEVDTRARITFKTEPGFTDEARRAHTIGTVRLLAILTADGSVKHVVTLESLGHGMTEKSVEAARKMRFEPATKDGRAVSQVIMLEYNFNM